jgi:ribose transport system permease protein
MTTATGTETAGRKTPSGGTRPSLGWGWVKDQYPIIILVLLLIVAAFSTDAFFTPRNLTNLVVQVSVIGIVTLAQFMIIVTAGIDISVGSVVALAGVTCAMLYGGQSVVLAILVAVVVGALCGSFTGYLVSFRGLEPFIVTLGMMALARGIVYATTEGSPVTPAAENFRVIATTTIAGVPLIALIWLGLALVIGFLMKRTVFGRRIYAIGSSKDAARASGIPVERTLFLVYMLAGAMVGFAGFLLTARVGAATPTAGNLYELDAIAAVVIGGAALAGGRGRVLGAVVGTLILGVITNLLVLLNVSTYMQDAFRGGLILFAIILTTVSFTRRKRKNAAVPAST